MPADALAPKVANASAGIISAVKDATYIVFPEFIWSTWVKPNPRHDLKCYCVSLIIFKNIQHVKS